MNTFSDFVSGPTFLPEMLDFSDTNLDRSPDRTASVHTRAADGPVFFAPVRFVDGPARCIFFNIKALPGLSSF